VRDIVSRVFPDIPVVSYDEIAAGVDVKNVGVIAPLEAEPAYAGAEPLAVGGLALDPLSGSGSTT